jgi:hypothetical protein
MMKYYAIRGNYIPHSSLVLVPRWTGSVVKHSYEHKGNLYSSIYGVDVPATRFVGSHTEDGFRSNGSREPFDILVLGDSYVEIGETDQDTFSERLSAASGLSAFNLGRAWYGPYQYLELLKMYESKIKPRYVLLCFFAGNDTQDILEYENWKNGKGYYYFDLARLNIFQRYTIVMSEAWDIFLKLKQYLVDSSRQNQEIHPELGLIDLGQKVVTMRFLYWNAPQSTQELLGSSGWRTLRSLLMDFRQISRENSGIPLLAYIPTKLQVYGRHATPKSGRRFLARLQQQLTHETNAEEALERIGQDLGIPTISLLPGFSQKAEQGELLYYPFDTHWNSAGRQAAAEIVASFLVSAPWSVYP